MGDRSAIEWTDATWNPVAGCTRVSAGCDNCYAARQAATRLRHTRQYRGLAIVTLGGRAAFNGEIRLLPERLDQPLHWTKPRRVFVNSMSDLFHEGIPDDYVDDVFAVMALARRHTFQVLTKRPQRMLAYMTSTANGAKRQMHVQSSVDRLRAPCGRYVPGWPLPNVWLGVSVEDQRAADERISILLDTPAVVRFLSVEPLLGPVYLTTYLRRPGIAWVIVGGESGPGFRPMDPAWAREIRDQCVQYGVPFFFKQVGGRTPKAGGRMLDGRTWDEIPDAVQHRSTTV